MPNYDMPTGDSEEMKSLKISSLIPKSDMSIDGVVCLIELEIDGDQTHFAIVAPTYEGAQFILGHLIDRKFPISIFRPGTLKISGNIGKPEIQESDNP